MFLKRIAPVAFATILFSSSCTEPGSKSNTPEQAEIKTMDSTSKALKETSDNLEHQTDKVEASLEKLDQEFKSNN